MYDLKACTVCFSTNVNLYNMDSGTLRQEFNLISGLKTDCSGLPKYLCVECSAYVKRFVKFRKKCQRAHFTLRELQQRNKEISIHKLEAIDRECLDLKPTLSYIDINRTNYEEAYSQWTRTSRLGIYYGDIIPIIHHSTYTTQVIHMPKKQETIQLDVKVEEEPQPSIAHQHLEQPISIVKDDDDYFDNNDNISDQHSDEEPLPPPAKKPKGKAKNLEPESSSLDEEYASMVAITDKEAQAAVDVYRLFSHGTFRCEVCNKGYNTQQRLTAHLRMHDQHVSGNFLCNLCNYYYKTEYLLKTHTTEKHMYKYECKKCNEVSFDRLSAKQHYIWAHLQRGRKKDANWYESRPKWLSPKGGKRVKGVVTIRPVRKINKLPPDFPMYSPVKHEEQYELILDRKTSRNYLEAEYKCELCYRGFRAVNTYSKHMRKHDPAYAGAYSCDMCKLHFKSPRKVYRHMNITHLFKYSCQICKFVCFNKGQAHMHYRWHKNVTYQCPHCEKEFKKASTRLTHIRIKHPSTNICNMCGHSFVSENGLYCHKQLAHSTEERDVMNASIANPQDPLFCADCNVQFLNEAAFATHLGSSNKHATTNLSIVKPSRRPGGAEGARRRGRPRSAILKSEVLNNGTVTSTSCDLCGEHMANDVQARKHYAEQHPGAEFLKRYMCDVCGHTTRQYANLMVHMRTHTNEKPYECPHCDRRFSMPSNRDRHLVVHTGEKRYQCQHCNRRFTQSTAVKLHIQTVHLKIPYKPWEKKNRKRRKEEPILGPVSSVNVNTMAQAMLPQHKLLLETQGDYLNAFISYTDE
ncbi:zinc finger protein 420-like [Cydia strobilella]|uniref:zinc finger protein 420-like n=1 Tax=Cydia strobilella TaxID=1100964 RepID=UPI003007047C